MNAAHGGETVLCINCKKCVKWEGNYYCDEERDEYVNGESDILTALNAESTPFDIKCYEDKGEND